MHSKATVSTSHGSSYLKRLCRHFSHKVPTTFTTSQGRIELPFAICRIDVDEHHMYLSIEDAESTSRIEKAEKVVADHLVRMANKDTPVVVWNRSQ